MNTKITRTSAVTALEEAIASYAGETGPGVWGVEGDGDYGGSAYVLLTYEVEAEEMSDDCDVIWKKWGGEAILAAAGLETCGGGGADRNQDKWGVDTYYEWGRISVVGEEE